jgi:hypothetical protein
MADVIVERCRRVRDQLLEQYGGLDGLFRKLEVMDRQREQSRVARGDQRGRKAKRSKQNSRASAKTP